MVLAILAVVCVVPPVEAEPRSNPRCPLRFDDDTVGLPTTCLFIGRYNDSCGGNVAAVFSSDGQAMVVGVAVGRTSPMVYLPGEARSSTDGKIVRWSPDLQLTTAPEEGTASLEDDGLTLRVRMPATPFRVDGCPFAEFVGRFTEMVQARKGARASDATARASFRPEMP